MKHARRWTLLSVLLLAASARGAAAPPSAPAMSPIPDGVGVNIHFTDPKPQEMKELADAGFKWVRMDFGWSGIEREKGKYDFAAYDRLMKNLDEHHIRPIFILDYSNRFYDNGQSPHSDEGRAAFAAWAAASVKHFKGRGVLWEMYNEPNIFFWRPKPNVDDYAKLAIAVGKAIREAEPNEIYIGPASSTIDLHFLESCFKAGCLEYWSAVSVHPYRQNDPENVSAEYRKLRQLIAKYAPEGRQIPIISGEWGYSSAWKNFDEQRQGKYLPRELLVNTLNDVPVSIWYDWHDDGSNPAEPEHHFGTVHFDADIDKGPLYPPKPAYWAMKALSQSLSGFKLNKRLAVGGPNDYVLLFTNDKGDTRLAAWTADRQSQEVKIPASPGVFTVTGWMGEQFGAVMADASGLPVTLNDGVQYLVPEKPNDLLRLAAAWQRLPDEMVVQGPTVAHVSASLTNPLSRAITLKTNNGAQELDPGAKADIGVDVPVSRNAEALPVEVSIELKGQSRLVQRTDVLVADPLHAILLPRTGKEVHIILENPSGLTVNGTAWLTDASAKGNLVTCDATMAAGQTRKILTFPVGPRQHTGEQEYLAIRTPGQVTLLALTFDPTLPVGGFARIVDEDALRRSYRILPDGSYAVKSEQTVSPAAPEAGSVVPGAVTLKITYRFDAGWKFIRLEPMTDMLREVEGHPQALGIWVFGDGQGNHARMRFTDSTGQVFQSDGGRITWADEWRYVTIPVNGEQASHWGGANDGIVHYPIRIDTLFLLDGDRHPTQGTIYLSEPAMIYTR